MSDVSSSRAWVDWDEVLASDYTLPVDPATGGVPDRASVAVTVFAALQPLIDRPRRAPPRVPAWAFELAVELAVRLRYDVVRLGNALAWCQAGERPVERAEAVLACFDLDANARRVDALIAGRAAPEDAS